MKGVDFLEFKREQLIFQIKQSWLNYLSYRKKFLDVYRRSMLKLYHTYKEMGKRNLSLISKLSKIQYVPLINVKYEKKIGNIVPRINYELMEEEELPAYSFENTSHHLDDLIIILKDFFKNIILLAEVEDEILKFAYNFQKLNRRINGLKYKIIPDLQMKIKEIKNLLEEIDRENFVRLKKIKDLIKKKQKIS